MHRTIDHLPDPAVDAPFHFFKVRSPPLSRKYSHDVIGVVPMTSSIVYLSTFSTLSRGDCMKPSRIILAVAVVLSLAFAGVSLYSSSTCETACAPCETCP